MNKDKYVFAQLVGFLDNFKFLRIVKKYDGDKYVKSYTYWNQLLTPMFGQLSNRESLRDLIVAMEAHAGKLYHLGIGKSVTRSNLSKATLRDLFDKSNFKNVNVLYGSSEPNLFNF